MGVTFQAADGTVTTLAEVTKIKAEDGPLRCRWTCASAGEIEVSFDIDSSGIVSVSARDVATGMQQSITVNSKSTLSAEELELLIEENSLFDVDFKA